MGKRRKGMLGGGAFSLASFLWGGYSHLKTAEDLPDDVGKVRIMLADPPPELPWVLAFLGLMFVAWVWLRWTDDEEDSHPTESQSTNGNDSPIQHAAPGSVQSMTIDRRGLMESDGEKGAVSHPSIRIGRLVSKNNGGAGAMFGEGINVDIGDADITDNKGGGIVHKGRGGKNGE